MIVNYGSTSIKWFKIEKTEDNYVKIKSPYVLETHTKEPER